MRGAIIFSNSVSYCIFVYTDTGINSHTALHCYQSGSSPKVLAIFSATNFRSYIMELLQLHDTIQIN